MSCPMGNKPDCFHCPLPDCYADTHDLTKQATLEKVEALEKRNQIIVRDYLNGTELNGLAERYGFKDASSVRRILRKNGVDFSKIEKERRICRK